MTYKKLKEFRIYLEGKGIPLCFLTVGEFTHLWKNFNRGVRA